MYQDTLAKLNQARAEVSHTPSRNPVSFPTQQRVGATCLSRVCCGVVQVVQKEEQISQLKSLFAQLHAGTGLLHSTHANWPFPAFSVPPYPKGHEHLGAPA